MAKLRKPKPTPIVTTSNTSTVSALPSLLTSSLSRPASIAISETDFTSTFFDHLNQEDVGSSIHSSSKLYSKEDYLNTDITSSSKASVRSGSSSLESFPRNLPPPSPPLTASPDSVRGTGSALTRLREQQHHDEMKRTTAITTSTNTSSSSSTSSLMNLTMGSSSDIYKEGSRKLRKKVRPSSSSDNLISGDSFERRDNNLLDDQGSELEGVDEVAEEEEEEEVVVVMETMDDRKVEKGFINSEAGVGVGVNQESLSRSLFLAGPRLSYYLATSTMTKSLSTSKKILSLPLQILHRVPPPPATATAPDQLVLSPSKSILTLPSLDRLTYDMIELGATLSFASLIVVGAGANFVWKRFRGN